MSDARARVLERVRQNRAARVREVPMAPRAVPGSARHDASMFPAGSRAFDTVSGQHVEVIGGTSENIVVPAPERPDR